jgi:hypothetical protein
MKIEWQAEDVQAGRRIGHPDHLEQQIIGYLGNMRSDEARWALVSLSDGMIMIPVTREELAAKLNAMGNLPIEMLPFDKSARGKLGGTARARALSPQRRSEISSAAATARWDGEKSAIPRAKEIESG